MNNKDRNRILALLFAGVFMGSLDIGIIGPALPAIQNYFMVDTRAVSWIFAIYLLFFMIGTPVMAKMSDNYGRRKVYVLDVLLFAVGSVITVSSGSFSMMIIGRAVQGFGAGGIFPVASAFIGDTFPPEKRGSALGIIGSVWGVSGVLGPVLGAVLLKYGWQWLFIINIPIAAVIILASFLILPESREDHVPAFDFKGTAVLSVLVASLAYGMNQMNTSHFVSSFLSWDVLPFLIVAVALLPLLLRIERKASDPVVQVSLLSNREVKLATSVAIGTGLCQSAIVFLPAFAVVALSFTTSQASLMVLPLVVALGVAAPIVGRFLDSYGYKAVMVAGSMVIVAGLLTLATFGGSLYLFIAGGILVGVGLSTVLGSPLRYIMLAESPASQRAAGQAIINLNASAGQLVGGAFVGGVIASQAGTFAGYSSAYVLIAVVALGMFFLALGLKNRAAQIATLKKSETG
jgi:EmrB/QacA subfamily drug resistance transporter